MRKYALAVVGVLLLASVAGFRVLNASPENGGDTPDQGCHSVCSSGKWFEEGGNYFAYSKAQAVTAYTVDAAEGAAVHPKQPIQYITRSRYTSGWGVCDEFGEPQDDHELESTSGFINQAPVVWLECYNPH